MEYASRRIRQGLLDRASLAPKHKEPAIHSDRNSDSRRIGWFILFTVLLSSPWWWVVRQNSSSVYVTFMMWSPGLAAALAIKMTGGQLSALGWRGSPLRWVVLGAATTLLGLAAVYGPIIGAHLVNFAPPDLLAAAVDSVHGPRSPRLLALSCLAFFMLTAGSIRLAGAALGEELGWRGFLAPALCRRYGFPAGSLISGALWAVWHFPIMIGRTSVLQLAAFAISITGVGVAMAWFRLKSDSVWPSTAMHAIHNSMLIGFFTKLTPPGPAADKWLDETGCAMPFMGVAFILFFLFVAPPVTLDRAAPH